MTLSERLAGTLGELDGYEVELVQRQAELSAQLSEVETELGQIAAVRQAIVTGQAPQRTVRRARNGGNSKSRLLEYARSTPDGFTAGDAAEALGTRAQGTGPALSALVRDGTLEREEREGQSPLYRVVASS